MNAQRKILLADLDGQERRQLTQALQADGRFHTVCVDGAADVVAALDADRFAAFVLAADLPDLDGGELCAALRRRGVREPILIIGSDNEASEVQAFAAGAMDYIARPVRAAAMAARLNAHVEQFEQTDHAMLTIGRFVFRPSRKRLFDAVSRRTLRLTLTEATLLKHLYRAERHYASREDILTEVLGYSLNSTTHAVETHVYRLRRKLEAEPTQPKMLVTEPGGYRLAIESPLAVAGHAPATIVTMAKHVARLRSPAARRVDALVADRIEARVVPTHASMRESATINSLVSPDFLGKSGRAS